MTPCRPRSVRGLTPACAGTTAARLMRRSTRWAHPRVRGDDQLGHRRRRRQQRLTPACAGTTTEAPPTPRATPAHPRVRGDDGTLNRWGGPAVGSPPRARGRLRHSRGRVDDQRLTPACAGTTRAGAPPHLPERAHPRVRGDDPGGGAPTSSRKGSPPRARRRRRRSRRAGLRAGLTPACAGTTCTSDRHTAADSAHPRVRGDDTWPATPAPSRRGSPPRARGRLSCGCIVDPGGGLTPACAGTTGCDPARGGKLWAHPRVRGDDGEFNPSLLAYEGSPPRARGRRDDGVAAHAESRLTPACAGTTWRRRSVRLRAWAHPRVRGDDVGSGCRRYRGPGSPPRARGRRLSPLSLCLLAGLTPACAGTTDGGGVLAPAVWAHPRVRGDDCRGRLRVPSVRGSPPRARGRRHLLGRYRGEVRLTPACAGTTGTPSRGCRPAAAHPRVRGDDPLGDVFGHLEQGSPPRARGRLEVDESGGLAFGLTPACAGTTASAHLPASDIAAHPRVRGDDVAVLTEQERRRGSPPRARGRPRLQSVVSMSATAHPRVRGDDHHGPTCANLSQGSPPRARGRRWGG